MIVDPYVDEEEPGPEEESGEEEVSWIEQLADDVSIFYGRLVDNEVNKDLASALTIRFYDLVLSVMFGQRGDDGAEQVPNSSTDE